MESTTTKDKKDAKKDAPAIGDDHAALDANGDLHPFYCPGCGRGYAYPAECSGTAGAPHKPIQTVSTDELDGNPESHTPAPDSE